MKSLPSINVPVLVLVGARDKAFLAAADYLAARIPGAVRSWCPSAGHMQQHRPARPLQSRRWILLARPLA